MSVAPSDAPPRRLRLEGIHRSRHALTVRYAVDDLRFSTSYWYAGVDLPRLEARYGAAFMEKVYFHIAAFEFNGAVTLRPRTVDLGPWKHLHTPAFEELWRTVARHAFAQWRYEHDLPDYTGPAFTSRPAGPGAGPVTTGGGREVLLFCGGGKDSLATLKLLRHGGVPHGTFVYSHSVYGTAGPQHALADRLIDHGAPEHRHRAWIQADFLDSPVARLYPELGVDGLAVAETPASVFAAVPLLLAHGYRHLVVGHERGANTANLVWRAAGEEVNHQWGKSRAAQLMLDAYLRAELVADAGYFSLLEPLHDAVIVGLLRDELHALPTAHSCNVRKPWCRRCAKCAYVWLTYLAYLPREAVEPIFGENLFDVEENQVWFRQMLGLDEHSPFECVGEIGEARLAFELCRRKGCTGRAVDLYTERVPRPDVAALADRYLRVDTAGTTIPEHVLRCVVPQMTAAAAAMRRSLGEL
ncbi:hypothetical protein ACFP1Z_27745 [Streptomyces gamaensis]|uniref:UDP-N-acetyl-alpha-D-muramoyl-L-alanyl-L-glutamate epimerase n=1 Tax=Streptomyces gamaensis TaxID=1763542 RepID=A0ABW0Z582_9ACTN